MIPLRPFVHNLAEAHEMYGLFRKGQEIGFLSTLMQDPSDAYTLTNEDLHELQFYKEIFELSENVHEDWIKIRVSKRENVPFNSPSGSWLQFIYPFAENKKLADKFKKFTGDQIMIGKMLEEIDAIWAESAFRFIRGEHEE